MVVRKNAGIKRRFPVIMVSSVLAVFSIGGLSVYTALSPGNLQKTSSGLDIQLKPLQNTSETTTADVVSPGETGGLKPESGRSDTNINWATMPDGHVVSVYSPRPSDGDGPVLMRGQSYGQDPRMAMRPNEELLKETAVCRLPPRWR